MTVAFFSGKGRRAGVALGAVSAGLLVLAACDKPTPIATVTVGTSTTHTEASCYNDGNAIKSGDVKPCLNEKADHSIKVATEDTVRFGVDPKIADHGWELFLNGQQAEGTPSKTTYRTFPGASFFQANQQTGQPAPDSLQVSVVEIGGAGGQEIFGVWHFELKKKKS